MKTERTGIDSGEPDVSWAGTAWARFWFTPIPTTGLHVVRIASGLLFLGWLLSFVGHQAEFFGPQGWFDLEAIRAVRAQNIETAPIGWSILYLAGNDVATFNAIYYVSLIVLALFTLGIATRITSILTWVVVVSFLANPATSYEGDYMLGILAFYTMIGCLLAGQWNGNLTPLERIVGSHRDFVFADWLAPRAKNEETLSTSANLTMRLLQIHFSIILVTSGLHKLQIAEWWSGVAFWYPLHPTFKTTLEDVRRGASGAPFKLFYLSLLQYCVLAWQIGFPLFAWRTGRWRAVLLGGAAIGWLGMIFVYGLPLFGPFVAICCLSYLQPDEWAWIKGRIDSIVGGSTAATSPKERGEPAKVSVTVKK